MPLVSKTFSQIITFTRASSATYFDAAGVLQTATTDVPRFDYNPSTLAALGFLIEEARTNSLLRSEEFSDASWSKAGSTVTADSTTAPNGTTTADTLTEDTSTGQHRVFRTTSGTTNTNPYTVSFFAKASTRSRVYVGLVEGTTFARSGFAVFDLSAGTVVSTGGGSGGATGGSATIQNVGNGWYRCTYTLTLGGTDTTIFNDINLVSTGTTISYTGNGTGAIFLWGAQLEAGAFPTSYIPTTTTAVTRAADVASVNTLSPWYNAAAGTLYAEGTTFRPYTAVTGGQMAQLATDANNRMWVAQGNTTANTSTNSVVQTGGVTVADLFYGPVPSANFASKAAFAYASNDFAGCTNGGSVITDTAGAVPSVNTLFLGISVTLSSASNWNGWLRRITYYPRRLTNAELQTITT